MQPGKATGLQITFFSFAVLLLSIPITNYLGQKLGGSGAEGELIAQVTPFFIAGTILLSFRALRTGAMSHLSRPIPEGKKGEVLAVAIAKVPLAFAYFGGLALWYWITEGESAVRYHLNPDPFDRMMAEATSRDGVVVRMLLASVVAPVVEEIVFRGFLYRAWERRWGWMPAMVLTSALFGIYHPHFMSAFVGSIVYVCLLRRTGSLRAPILAHGFFNLMLWYPFFGQFLVPDESRAFGDLANWAVNLACLLFAAIAFPVYLWLAARHPHEASVEMS